MLSNLITETLKLKKEEWLKDLSKLQGLLHHALYPQFEDEFYATVPQVVKDGAIKYREDISQGLETVGQALSDVGLGRNFGKRVVIVSED